VFSSWCLFSNSFLHEKIICGTLLGWGGDESAHIACNIFVLYLFCIFDIFLMTYCTHPNVIN
jgi:hypothetical protein